MTKLEKEIERREDQLIRAVTDEAGNLRPITRIQFEVLGGQVRWSLFENDRLLHALTDRLDEAAGFLEPTRDLLEMLAEDFQQKDQRTET